MKQKTKKIILLISTVLSLLITLGYIFAITSGNLNLETINDAGQLLYTSQVLVLFICAISNILSIFVILKDVVKHKKKIIFLNVIQLLFGTMFNIISAIINIAVVASKTTDVEEPIKEKKELPILEDITKHKWYVYFTIFVFLFAICYTPILNILPIPETKIAAIITMIVLYIVQVLALVIPMASELKRDFIVFKNNFKLYLGNMLPRFGIIVIGYFISNISVLLLVGNIPNNQQTLVSMPLYITAFLGIVIGPLTEELMFRGFIKKFIKNDLLFIMVSSLVFGGLHVLSADSFQQVLYIIPYSILGFAFSLNYVKTKTIASNIFLHSAWNTLAVIFMALTTI